MRLQHSPDPVDGFGGRQWEGEMETARGKGNEMGRKEGEKGRIEWEGRGIRGSLSHWF